MRAIVVVCLFVGLAGGMGGSTGCSSGGSMGTGSAGTSGAAGTTGGAGTGGSGGAAPFKLTSNFGHLEPIPAVHTCAGADTSPPFDWTGPPAATQGFALLLTDLEPTIPVTQWIVWDIPADARSLPAGLPESSASSTPLTNQVSYRTDNRGYEGPCPGGARHKFQFRLYALDGPGLPGVTLDSTVREVIDVILDHTIAYADVVGTSDADRP